MRGQDELVRQLRKPAPPFGMEEYDPTFDVRQEAARTILAMQEQINALDQQCQGFANLNAKLKADNKEMGYSFDVRWGASRRATERWQAANPGNDLTWPDHADVVVWCLDQLATAETRVKSLEAGLCALLDVVEKQPRIAKLLPEDGSPLAVARALVSHEKPLGETQASLPFMDETQSHSATAGGQA